MMLFKSLGRGCKVANLRPRVFCTQRVQVSQDTKTYQILQRKIIGISLGVDPSAVPITISGQEIPA